MTTATNKIIKEAVSLEFTQRVAFIALQSAQDVASESPDTENHANRVAYADRIFRGEEKALSLALHIVGASPEIMAALEEGTQDDVQDEDIINTFGAIWNARANAYGTGAHTEPANQMLSQMLRIRDEMINKLDTFTTNPEMTPEQLAAQAAEQKYRDDTIGTVYPDAPVATPAK
jgi:hypothetical protein